MGERTPLPWPRLAALGIAQIISWGSFYYAFALLIPALKAELHASQAAVVGAFSVALLAAGLVSAPVGAWIDRHGARGAMGAGSLVGGLALTGLSFVQDLTLLYALWAVIGTAMAATLYDPVFAAVTRALRDTERGPRPAITMLTLFGGFASTVFWPLTQALVDGLGWRSALLALAAINIVVALPLQLQLWGLPREQRGGPAARAAAPRPPAEPLGALLRHPLFIGLAAAFTLNTLVFSALSVHLIGLLQSKSLTAAQAALVGASIGPVQVFGRAVEYLFLGRWQASTLGRLVICLLPAALVALLLAQGVSAAMGLFVLLYGFGNGMITIVRGALPVELWGATRYGLINGFLATPVLLAKAAGPMAAALLLAPLGAQGVLVALTGVAVAAALLFGWGLRHR